MQDPRVAPTTAEMALLASFPGLSLERICVPETKAQFAAAATDLAQHRFLGFDTESRPTFRKGEVSQGPHVVQLTTLETAYIFQLHRVDCHAVLGQLLEATDLVKVGFELKSDRAGLQRKLGITTRSVLDLTVVFRRDGYRKAVGVRAAVAIVFNQRLRKSRSVTTSNWAAPKLTPNQLLYAANDAYAAIRVLHALNKPESELPIADHSGQPS
ncbi:MAG: 3'-5' exonuclease domain-containing protein 2 [Candidatus Accumulibacter phosphatis]|uniref:3'-5' exonuclease n=2 Tax=Candidatus Accumulibacter TaxID=327159 RepID=A0A080M1K3_9PROT|nr:MULTISPECIES: 3'-5' exonuclease [Candidatus Accumulibacter]KFB74991.1 MAG: ribonuclease D [Candidatus Accumulibacter cognatus]MBN8517469.1 3'-5' exonuclease domain-containing protein 2 [Accumulibacter sp.]MBO3710748.1 3'-5' exonuclease domain-containing protein 2 [Accumulibacter sp.]MCQ1549883.1 3'-5' exonuclease domain-containing protein 2 [Candidatus Accumulibacter phosphatis]QLH50354.1 MAG: 3'-5' exonuclease domain-containing protein 2 [Candidatus Accumulibacter cognatus]